MQDIQNNLPEILRADYLLYKPNYMDSFIVACDAMYKSAKKKSNWYCGILDSNQTLSWYEHAVPELLAILITKLQ